MKDILLKRNELRNKSIRMRTIKFDPSVSQKVADKSAEEQDKIYKQFDFYNHFIKAREVVKSEKNKFN